MEPMILTIDLFLTLLIVGLAVGCIACRAFCAIRRTRSGTACTASCACPAKGNPAHVLSAGRR